MKNKTPIIVLVLVAAAAAGAYYYSKKADKPSVKSSAMIVSEAAPEPFTDEEISAFTESQKEASIDETLKAATLAVFEKYKGSYEDEAIDDLIKLLTAQSIDTEAWTVIAPKGEKKIVVAKMENSIFKHLDPHLGVIVVHKQSQAIIGPYAARFVMSGGGNYEDYFVELAEGADNSFYKDFAHVMMAPPGHPVYVHIAAPVFQEPIVLGELDGSAEDVAESASALQLTPYLNYIGQKHGDQVERQIYFTDPAVVTLTLTKPYDESIMTANIDPVVDGNSVTFEVPADEPLILEDLSADFIDVDQLVIKPL